MVLLSTLLVLGAAPLKLSTTPLSTNNTTSALAAFCVERAAATLRRAGLEVITTEDIATLLGAERQRQLLGCAESSTECLAELSGALGSDAVLVGRLAKLDDTFDLALKVLDSRTGQTLAAFERTVGAERDLGAAAEAIGGELAAQLGVRPALGLPVARWTTFGLGAALAIASGVSFGVSQANADALRAGETRFTDPLEARGLAEAAARLRTFAIGAAIGAGALLLTGVVLWLVSPSPRLALRLDGRGAALAWDFL